MKVSDATGSRVSQKGGKIMLNSAETSGTAIEVTNSGPVSSSPTPPALAQEFTATGRAGLHSAGRRAHTTHSASALSAAGTVSVIGELSG